MTRILVFFASLTLMASIYGLSANNPYYREIPNRAIEKGAFRYIPLSDGFKYPNSAWGSIGITDKGLVYVVVCDHIKDAAIYEYDTRKDKLAFLGLLRDHLHHRFHFQRQPKVHTPLLQYSKDGCVYFGTDAGEESEDALSMHFDEGYCGGFLLRLDPVSKAVENLGLIERRGGIKSLAVDQNRGRLYFTTSPASELYYYEIGNGALNPLGRVNGYKIVRTLFFDRWDNVYGASESGNLLRYNVARDTIEYLDISPFNGSTVGPSQAAYGPNRSYIVGFNSYTGHISKYYPDSAGTGGMEDLGVLFKDKGVMSRNMNISGNRLYVVCTSDEGIDSKDRFRFLAVYDLDQKKLVKKVDMEPFIHQAYGHPVMDKNGNMYVCGFWECADYNLPKDLKDRVYLIQINPKKL